MMKKTIKCCVPNCNFRNGVVVNHRFPNPKKHLEMLKKWVEVIGNMGLYELDADTIYGCRRVCHMHFEAQYILERSKRLFPNAVPTLYLPRDVRLEHNYSSTSTVQVSEESCKGSSKEPTGLAVDYHNPSTSSNMEDVSLQRFSDVDVREIVSSREKDVRLEHNYSSTSTVQVSEESCKGSSKEPTGLAVDYHNPSTSSNMDDVSLQGFSDVDVREIVSSTEKEAPATPSNILKYCGISRKQMSPKEKKLYCHIQRLYRRYNSAKKEKISFKRRLLDAKTFEKQNGIEEHVSRFNNLAAIFLRCQFREVNKSTKLRRFTLNEKILALSFYKQSRKAYMFLSNIFVLPSKSTLDRLIQDINIEPGINKTIFEALKVLENEMEEIDKYVAVLFDEMSIMPSLNFNENKGIIEGFEDMGYNNRDIYIADHILLFMIRGIKTNTKAPICFNFTSRGGAKTQQIKCLLKEVLEQLIEIGLKPITVICDQVGNNVSVLNSLMKDTQTEYISRGAAADYKYGFFEVNGFKIYPILDPPHLLKGIRNNLLKKNLKYTKIGIQKVAKWEHIRNLYQNDSGSTSIEGLRALPHLTEEHIFERKLKKMKVKHAAQIFSQRVAATLMLASKLDTGNKIGEGAADTAEILLFFDKLFDSVNGGRRNPEKGKVYRCGITNKTMHLTFWNNEALPLLKSMEFVKLKKYDKKRPPSLKNWTFTINNFIEIWKILNSKGLQFLLPRRLNQDPLENMFGLVRSFGSQYKNPSATACIGIFKGLFVNFSFSLHKKSFNCEDDKCENIFVSVKHFMSKENVDGEDISMFFENNENIEVLCHQIKLTNLNKFQSNSLSEKLSHLAQNYVAGFILKKIKKYIKCMTCKNSMFTDLEHTENTLIAAREYGNGWSRRLTYPTLQFVDYFYCIIRIINYHLHTQPHSISLVTSIKQNIVELTDFNFFKCEEHKQDIIDMISKISIRTLLHHWCKDVNKILSGKETKPYLGNNIVKKQAYEIFKKRRRMKNIKKGKDSI